MATKKAPIPATKRTSRKPAAPNTGKPVALTLKVSQALYERLCLFGAKQRRTNQDILNEALQEYLKRVGA